MDIKLINNFNNYKQLYTKCNICLLVEKTKNYCIFVQSPLNFPESLIKEINQNFYKIIFDSKKSIVDNIPILIKEKYSVIILNNIYNVVAIHHPPNIYNSVNLLFLV